MKSVKNLSLSGGVKLICLPQGMTGNLFYLNFPFSELDSDVNQT